MSHTLEEEFGRNTTSRFLLFRDPAGELLATDETFRQEVARIVAPLYSDPKVSAIYTWDSTANATLNASLISDDNSMSLAVVVLQGQGQEIFQSFEDFRAQIRGDRLSVEVGGWSATEAAFVELSRSDLVRSEQLALPATLLLLVVVFGGVIAAGLPVALVICALIPSLAGIYLLSQLMDTSLFAVNIVSMLGLALGIDYSLIMVSRFREELAKGSAEVAVARTLATAGETIIVSGAAVMVGLLGLLVFRVPAAVSTGISAALVVMVSVVLAMTALPAAFTLAADRLRPRRRWKMPRAGGSAILRIVRCHPWPATILSVLTILILTFPVLNMRGAVSSMTILPSSEEARQVYDAVQAEFSNATLTPIVIVVTPTSGRMTSIKNLTELQAFHSNLEQLEGVESAQSVWSFLPQGVTASILSTSLLVDADVKAVARPYLTDNAAVIELAPRDGPSDESSMNLVRQIRTDGYALSGGAFQVQVGAEIGNNVDMVEFVTDRAPLTIGVVVGLMWLALFIRFRSVVLPTKAVLLNLLSLGASFGALVWIFQEGHLAGWFDFEPLGFTILIVPIIMFCFMFGLSMDYEVVMLSRIKEVWDETGDNDLAIDRGLAASARLVTSAALIMLVIFIAFGTSELQFIKQVGAGLGIAVLIDTTLIRLVLLPSSMRLFGKWNWWLPWRRT